MPASIRRPLVIALVLAVAVVAGAAPAFATTGTGRVRPDPGPSALYVSGSATDRAAAGASRVTLRSSRRVSASTITWSTGPEAVSTSTTDRAPLAPVQTTHFDALQGFVSDPADPTGALGPTNVVAAVNTSVAVYDRTTGSVLDGPRSLNALSGGATGQKFDPKVVYDQYNGNFVLAFLVRDASERKSSIMVWTIPEATANDFTSWCGTRFRGDGVGRNGRQWADYPGLGYDEDSVTISTNAFNFGGGGYAYAQLYHISDAQLFDGDCTDPVQFHVFAGADTRNPGGSKAFTIQPAQTVGTSSDQYLLSYDPGAIVVWRLRETSRGLKLRRSAINVRRVQIAPYGTQKGGSYTDPDTWWDPGDLRLVNAFYDADLNRVYAAHTVFHDLTPDPIVPYPEAAIRWYEVRPTHKLRASNVTRTGIVGTPETDAGWPTVATDGTGNLFITYNRASKPEHEFLSAWAAEIAPGTKQAELTLLTAGTARFEAVRNDVERWGDFNAINRDPTNPLAVAMINQFALSDGSGTTRTWQQTFDLVTDG